MNKLLCVQNQHLGSSKSCRQAKVWMDADTEILPKTWSMQTYFITHSVSVTHCFVSQPWNNWIYINKKSKWSLKKKTSEQECQGLTYLDIRLMWYKRIHLQVQELVLFVLVSHVQEHSGYARWDTLHLESCKRGWSILLAKIVESDGNVGPK